MSRLKQSMEPERVLAFVVVVATTWKYIIFGGNVIAEYSGFLVHGAWFRDTISMQIPTDSILIPKCPVQGLLLLESLLFRRWQEIFIRGFTRMLMNRWVFMRLERGQIFDSFVYFKNLLHYNIKHSFFVRMNFYCLTIRYML